MRCSAIKDAVGYHYLGILVETGLYRPLLTLLSDPIVEKLTRLLYQEVLRL